MKGISIVERHFEKAILALIALGIGGYAVVDMAGLLQDKPKMGGREVGLQEIADQLNSVSKEVGSLQGGTEVGLEMPASAAGDSIGDAVFEKPVTSGEPIPRAVPVISSNLFSKSSRPIPLYHEPALAAAKMADPVLQRDNAVAVPADDAGKALAAFLDERPSGWSKGDANVIWTTPTAEVDLAAVRAELARSENGRERLPVHWWQPRTRDIIVLDVRFERQERLADGSWGESTLVRGLPGVASLRGQKFTSLGGVLDALKKSPDMQDQILKPALPPMVVGAAQAASSAGSAPAPANRKLADARKSLDDATRLLEQKTTDLDKAGGPYEGSQKGGKGGGSSSGGTSSGSSKGGSGGGAGRPTDEGDPNVLRKRRALTLEVEKLKAEVAALTKKVDELAKADAAGAKAAASGAPSDRMLVWANDFQVRPGAEYRYRCQVEFLNPFLGRRNELQPSQQKLDAGSGLLTAPSAWVAVRVRSPREFFALEAMPGEGASGLGMGRFELFKLDRGVWRSTRDMIEFGDRVGGPSEASDKSAGKVDFTTDWYVVGVYRDFAAEVAGARSSDRPTLLVLASASDPSRIVVRRTLGDAASPARSYLSEQVGTPAAATPAAASGSSKGG